MRAVIEVVVLANAIGGFGVWVARTFVKRKRESNAEQIRQLEKENREWDEAINRIKGGQK